MNTNAIKLTRCPKNQITADSEEINMSSTPGNLINPNQNDTQDVQMKDTTQDNRPQNNSSPSGNIIGFDQHGKPVHQVPKTHTWQVVTNNKRKRVSRQSSEESAEQIEANNRFEQLQNDDGGNTLPDEQGKGRKNNEREVIHKPPPIYIYGVSNYKDMIANLTTATPPESYVVKSMANNIIKVNPVNSETYRKLIHHLRSEDIIHHTYQLKEERAYRVVIRGLHHSIPIPEIKQELETKGHKVRNIINAKHRVSKDPLSLHFIDLEPQKNNKEIFNLEFLGQIKIRVEPPRFKKNIVQCTRCQDYGHSKTYCRKPYNCVKCGQDHDNKNCRKQKNTPATCALCQGDHPANYKGCTVYRDLMNMKHRNKGNRANTQNQPTTNTPQVQTLPQPTQPRNIGKSNKTYAQALNTQDTDGTDQLS